MKTKKLIISLTVLLLFLANLKAFGQNALDSNQFTYQVGSYTPSGNTGAYYEGLHFKYEITRVSVSSDNQSEYDKIQIVFRAFPGEVNTYKYNGKNYNVADLCNYNSRSLNHLSKFIMSISVSGGGTNEYAIETRGAAVIPLNKSYTREELKQVNVTNIKLVNIYPDDIAVTAVERCLNLQQKEKDENTTAINTANTVTNVSGTGQNTNNSNRTSTTNPYMDEVNAYNAKIRADAQSLDNAADKTLDGWANAVKQGKNADFITPSGALANEFARQGNAEAAYGTIGTGVAMQGISIISQARAEKKAREAAYNYEFDRGCLMFKQNNFKDALAWFYNSYKENKHTSAAANYIGVMFLKGLGVDASPTEAMKWFNIVIQNDKDVSPSYFYLARMYYEGIGVEKDANKAFQFMQKSSNTYGYIRSGAEVFEHPKGLFMGPDEAKYHLAFYYLTGNGVDQNYKKAYDLFLSLVNQDYRSLNGTVDKAVDFALGVMYHYGLGLNKNTDEANKYFTSAGGYDTVQRTNNLVHDTFGNFLKNK